MCPHVRMTLVTMLASLILLMIVSVLGNTETRGPSQTPDTGLYNKILSSMDISREVRKVFTSLWATPEVKVGLSIVFFLAPTGALEMSIFYLSDLCQIPLRTLSIRSLSGLYQVSLRSFSDFSQISLRSQISLMHRLTITVRG